VAAVVAAVQELAVMVLVAAPPTMLHTLLAVVTVAINMLAVVQAVT
jgi:hypothetical protein